VGLSATPLGLGQGGSWRGMGWGTAGVASTRGRSRQSHAAAGWCWSRIDSLPVSGGEGHGRRGVGAQNTPSKRTNGGFWRKGCCARALYPGPGSRRASPVRYVCTTHTTSSATTMAHLLASPAWHRPWGSWRNGVVTFTRASRGPMCSCRSTVGPAGPTLPTNTTTGPAELRRPMLDTYTARNPDTTAAGSLSRGRSAQPNIASAQGRGGHLDDTTAGREGAQPYNSGCTQAEDHRLMRDPPCSAGYAHSTSLHTWWSGGSRAEPRTPPQTASGPRTETPAPPPAGAAAGTRRARSRRTPRTRAPPGRGNGVMRRVRTNGIGPPPSPSPHTPQGTRWSLDKPTFKNGKVAPPLPPPPPPPHTHTNMIARILQHTH
jgi:hypothetical protein